MCGITGFIAGDGGGADAMKSTVGAMTETMWRRGPDDQGVWTDAEVGVALGHRRLRIIDLSSAGLQPMVSHCGRYRIVFNGEIYNFRELRQQLSGMAWRGGSDTEVFLQAIAAWGVETALQRSNGMFAFALWDSQRRELWLARDRFGEKPLYFGKVGSTFAFASELKPIRNLQRQLGVNLEIDREALALLLEFQYIPAPWSVFRSIRKLEPGHFVRIQTTEPGVSVGEPQSYWSLDEAVRDGLADPFEGSDTEAIDAAEQQLLRTVESRMEADVPLGAFLSGGVDSGLLVSLMQQLSDRPVRTFTIGFDRAQSDESAEAARIARHIGTDHTELRVTAEHSLDVIPNLAEYYDEPFADASQIPTHLVSRMAREHVTVSLSGDGGDEVFGGYMRYYWADRLNRRLERLPRPLRRAMGRGINGTPERVWAGLFAAWHAVMPKRFGVRSPVEKMRKLGSMCLVDGMEEVYNDLTKSHWRADEVVRDLPKEWGFHLANPPQGLTDPAQRMMFWDLSGYLPGDILTKVDRASMSVSLESRAPYLDHELVEFAWRLPLNCKVRGSEKKWIARQVLSRYVPKELFDHPKSGFETPLFEWLRGPLRDWAEDLLSEDRLRREGFFNVEQVRKTWNAHLSGKARLHYELWSVLMFQQWLDAG